MHAASLAGLLLAAAAVLPGSAEVAEVCDAQECGQPDEMAALQLQAVGADAWASKKTSRDLATVPPPQELTLKSGQRVLLMGAVPSQGPEGFFMALLFQYGNWKEKNWEALEKAQVHCSSPDGHHRVPARMFGGEQHVQSKTVMVLQCPWPQEEVHRGVYDIRLSEAGGHEVGQVQASYQPGLLKQYGTTACINNIWNGEVATLKLTPPWMEFQLLHGVDHFLVYTMNGTDVTVLDLYEPYIAAGVATRVHLNTRPALSTGYATHNWMVNDCLYRARGHTRWLMPTVDVDEYVRFRPSLMTGDYMRTVWDKLADSHKGKDGKPDHRQVSCVMLDRVIFERAVPDPDLEISNVYRYPRSSLCPKYVARASLINVLFIHWPTSWVNGSVWQKVGMDDGFINHYRNSSTYIPVKRPGADMEPNVVDDALVADIPAVSMALEKRFGGRWKAFAEKLKKGSSISIVQLSVSDILSVEPGCTCQPDAVEYNLGA